MKNKLQASIPFFLKKLSNLLGTLWLTKSQASHPNAIIDASDMIEQMIDSSTASRFTPIYVKDGDLPSQSAVMDLLESANDSINDVVEEGLIVGNNAMNMEAIIQSFALSCLTSASKVEQIINGASQTDTTHHRIVFYESFTTNMVDDSSSNIEIVDGHLSLRTVAYSNALSDNISSITVISNGVAGNNHEIVSIGSSSNSKQDDDPQAAADALLSEAGSLTSEGTQYQWVHGTEGMMNDPLSMISPDTSFELECVDLSSYTIPVEILSPFKVFKNPTTGEAILWGDAIERTDSNDPQAKMISVWEYTLAKDATGAYPLSGIGWTYKLSPDVKWTASPGDMKINDINSAPAYGKSENRLYAEATILLKKAVSTSQLYLILGSLCEQYSMPYVAKPIEILVDGKWQDTTPTSSNGIIVSTFNKAPVLGIKFALIQNVPYNTTVGVGYVKYDIQFTSTYKHKNKAFGFVVSSHTSTDEFHFIIRGTVRESDVDSFLGQVQDVINKSQVSDLSGYRSTSGGDIGNALGFGGSTTLSISGFDVADTYIEYGIEPFAAKRWAIRINEVSLALPKYEAKGQYISSPIVINQDIKSICIESYETDIPVGSSIKYSIKLPSGKILPIVPYNTFGDGVVKYVFDTHLQTGDTVEFIDEIIDSIQLIIELNRGASEDASPILNGCKVIMEV
jgi:hypothetical protein